jgi:adenine-specific DNA-methyltransferase
MKYMGSKRWMLRNGLGELIAREVQRAPRFVDLFSGSGAVSTHVAIKYEVPVKAYDLQTFSSVLTEAIVGRDSKIEAENLWATWYSRAAEIRRSIELPTASKITKAVVRAHRKWCAQQSLPITQAYGGHYFSASQAVWLDTLRQALPDSEPLKTAALAAILCAASECAAAPGHTAQPFQPTRTAKPFLIEAWQKDITNHCRSALFAIAAQYAKRRGRAEVADANVAAASSQKGDLVFIDPPYSGVHYSRFYHVLETIARGKCSQVSGTGRYPVADERPRSRYSLKSNSSIALDDLLGTVSERGATAILTFPQRRCSNGLSGSEVIQLACKHFKTEQHWVASKFSTLGGNNAHRDARRSTRELILVLRPE